MENVPDPHVHSAFLAAEVSQFSMLSARRPSKPSKWIRKAALILNVPGRMEHSKSAICSAAFYFEDEEGHSASADRHNPSLYARNYHKISILCAWHAILCSPMWTAHLVFPRNPSQNLIKWSCVLFIKSQLLSTFGRPAAAVARFLLPLSSVLDVQLQS